MAKFAKSAATFAIEKRLSEGSPNNELTVEEMEAICGLPCRTPFDRARVHIQSIIKHIEHEFGLVWRWQRDRRVWRCLTDTEKTPENQRLLHQARRRARRIRTIADSMDFDNLSESQKKTQAGISIAAAAMEIISTPRNVRRIQSVATQIFQPDTEKLLEICKSRNTKPGPPTT